MNNSVSQTIASGNFPWQTTISKPKSFSGIGLHLGNLINVKLANMQGNLKLSKPIFISLIMKNTSV